MSDYNEQLEQKRRMSEQRKARKRKRKQRALIMRGATLALLLVVLVTCIILVVRNLKGNKVEKQDTPTEQTTNTAGNTGTGTGEETAEATETPADTPEPTGDKASIMAQADVLAAGYDYDGAIALLQTVPDYANDSDVATAISNYTATKSTCVAADVEKTPHIFYHSLVNEPSRTFDVAKLGQSFVDGHQTWMATVSEFDKITQQLYDNGYVYVRLRDLVVETKDADGTVHFTPNKSLMLPPGKKPIVLSLDDMSYYHAYEAGGYPNKAVIDENGDVKCEYTDANGNTTVGDYDSVPRLNTFLKEHPDGSYKGARGILAMTGYNGVLGYRTDVAYKTGEKLTADQQAWLDKHPEFNWDTDVAEATKVANAIKEEGWEFASHTWGHISVTDKSAETLKTDNDKWVNTVENIVGPVDTIIFAHGNDIGDWHDYSAENEAYAYYKSAGYNYFCNVDGSQPYWIQIRDNYVRQGRIDLDGFMLNKAKNGQTTVLNGMIDAASVWDPERPAFEAATGKS
ncbi:MAG: polysaccharide deacetylase family protein [Lachnospiraceae bacterium]|nr:polysaccharide deacetylase family protein [Lachnospiraceae bacterium]